MPSTVNGIGTHYYGKKNVSVRTAVCKSCGKFGELTSYDTRLWFVVVFIPIIPLGRKRIIDQCRLCTRHYAVAADAYEQAKQLQTSGSLERYRREPSTGAAADAHAQLLGFHEHEQAAEFRRTALDRFPDDAGLRAAMAEHLWDAAGYEESNRLFQEALELDPESPEARVGTARFKAAQGDLDEASRLLDFLMEPGAGSQHSLEPLNQFAGRLQAAGKHEEALRIAEALRREHPALEGDHSFRAFVKRSEKALRRPESMLPKAKFSPMGLFRAEGSPYAPWQRRTAIGGVAAALILCGLAANNEYIRRHRTLHVLNATGEPVQVQVDGGPAVSVSEMGRLTVPEGPHAVKVSGPVDETHTITLESGYFDRWTRSPAWILNPGGEAVVDEIRHVYAAGGGPTTRNRVVGRPLYHNPNVDYLFTPAPDQIKVGKRKDAEVVKTEVNWARGEDLEAFLETAESDRKAAMDFAQKRLTRNPSDRRLLQMYTERARPEEVPRIETFLASGLDRRPVDVYWHRAYQTIAEVRGQASELIARYDQALAADPSNAALLYLRGRVAPDWDAAADSYRRSIEADPKLSWPHAGLAAQALAEGRWDDALAEAAKAVELRHEDPDRLAEMIHTARMAKGETSAVVDEARAAVAANPMDLAALMRQFDGLAGAGRRGEIDAAVTSFGARMPIEVQGAFLPLVRATSLYYAGKPEDCEAACAPAAGMKTSLFRLQSLLALGRSAEAADDEGFGAILEDPPTLLALAVGLGVDGKAEESATRREAAAARLASIGGATDAAKAAKLLAGAEPPAVRDVVRLHIDAEFKALLLVALAQKFPDRRAEFLAEAEKFDVGFKPPHLLIRRAVGSKTPGAS